MKKLKSYFDKVVDSYEKTGKLQKTVAEELLKKINKDFYSTVVEIGSGNGFLSIPLSKQISFKRFINIDISLEFLKRLKLELNDKALFINAMAEAMPLKENLANLLVSSSSLHWIHNPTKNFKELFNIIKNDGRFYFSIFTSNTLKELRYVSEVTGFGSVYPLKKAEFYIETIEKMAISFNYETKIYREIFASPKHLLISHKLTGTNYTENKNFSGKLLFKKFCDLYEKLFTTHYGVYATYEVLFIEGQKLSPFH